MGEMKFSTLDSDVSTSDIEITEPNILNIKSSSSEINDFTSNSKFIIQNSLSEIEVGEENSSSKIKFSTVNSLTNIENNESEITLSTSEIPSEKDFSSYIFLHIVI